MNSGDPIAPVILGVTSILFFAIAGRFGARKLGQPSVLGEVVIGIALGMIGYMFRFDLILVLREGPAIFDLLAYVLEGNTLQSAASVSPSTTMTPELIGILESADGATLMQVAYAVDVFSRYGVIFMLFMVGLESNFEDLRSVRVESTRVALIGVVLPAVLGFVTVRWLMPGSPFNTGLFVGATLAATSIGITARVLRDDGLSQTREGHVILGAAVIDDILGLIALAIISGMVVSGSVQLIDVLRIVTLATIFLAVAVYIGPYILRITVRVLSALDFIEAKMFTSFLFVMLLAWFANVVGLATIIGAFTAGIILHEGYFKDLASNGQHATIKDLISPLEVILAPIFFILIGIQVKLETFFDPNVILLAAGLLVVGVIGKIIAGLGAGRSSNRLLVGFAMIPRGEVGLVFVSIGKTLGVIDDTLFSAVVLMVVVTTLVAPPLVRLAARRGAR